MRGVTPRAAAVSALVALALLGAWVAGVGPSHRAREEAAGASSPAVTDYVVTLRSGSAAAVAGAHTRRFAITVGHVYDTALHGYSARMTAEQAAAVRADPRVATVSADVPIRSSSQDVPAGVRRVRAASASGGQRGGTVDADIAILDTGIDVDHPDLNVVGGTNCRLSGSFDDERGHGTHIAGIAAARDNDIGVLGVAPGARLWAVRVLNDAGEGRLSDLLCGIDWVSEHAEDIEVANMSLTGLDLDRGCDDGALHEAICESVDDGVVYTVAAGNNATSAARYTPASYPEVITVSALADFDGRDGGLVRNPSCGEDADDTFAGFSNHGSVVDLIAPGECVVSTWPGGGYASLSGTSMAAGYVAGAVALYRSANPQATPAQVRRALLDAGTRRWRTDTDPDGRPEPLLDVSRLDLPGLDPARLDPPDSDRAPLRPAGRRE